jgi:enoyl-CoA hydratase
MVKEYKTLRYEVDGPIAKLTLTRPEILNRMDDVTSEEVVHVIESLRRPGDVRVLIIASTGTTFSAGGDLDEVRRLISDFDRRMDAYDTGRRLIYGMGEITVPVVVALQGDVFGLGTSMALSGDIIIASKNVRIGDPHVKVGLVAGDGGCLVWPAAFGMARAKRHLLTGDPIGAEEAYRLGGVTDLVETPEEVLPLAEKLAAKIAALPPVAVQLTKRSLNHVMHKAAVDGFEFSMALEQYAITTTDLVEGLDAFKEKRKPVYRNR